MSWVSRDDALNRLGTKPQTLYANVSRGRIGAKPDPTDPRRSLYSAEDIERLASRQQGRRKAETVAAQAIDFGDPVLVTSISTIADGRLLYRGQEATALSQNHDLGQIAELLWGAERISFATELEQPTGRGIAPAFVALGTMAGTALPTIGRATAVLHRDGAQVVGTLVSALAGPGLEPVHLRLARHWQRPAAADLLRRALVLLAEHELNASTFAARVAASTGASLAASVLAGLAALSGPLHGGAAAAMRALVEQAEREDADSAVRNALVSGRPLPCFGHRLYPHGDVRAMELAQHFALPPLYQALAKSGEAAIGELPNIDFVLAALTAAHDLPPDAPLILFALGRSVGWLAHALEQVQTGSLIRPRATYVGVLAGR